MPCAADYALLLIATGIGFVYGTLNTVIVKLLYDAVRAWRARQRFRSVPSRRR